MAKTAAEISAEMKARLQGRLRSAPRMTDEEYEAAKARTLAANYQGICRPDCPICGGLGWVKVDPDAPLYSQEFGRQKYCPNVDLAKVYGEGLGLDEHEIKTLAWSNIKMYSNAGEAVEAVQETIAQGWGWVCLWGNYGLAKSLILRVTIAESLRAGSLASYIEMAGLLDDLRDAYDTDHPNMEAANRLDKWKQIPILAIDELEKINATPWAKEREFAIFNYRYQMAIRQRSVTIFASNLAPSMIGGALGDRLLDGRFKVVRLEGPSNRPAITREQDY